MSDFPRSAGEITAEWLTKVLREYGVTQDANVESFDLANIGDDQGVAGDVRRVELSYDRQTVDAPRTIIAKFARQDPPSGPIAAIAYEREVRFFQELAPASGMRTPESFHAEFDPGTGRFIILLEDLSRLRAP